MHVYIKTACVVLLTGCVLPSVQGTIIDAEQARQAAETWMSESPAFAFASRVETAVPVTLTAVEPIVLSGEAPQAWHVKLDPVGYIILAADDRLTPVMAFSVTSDLDLSPTEENALRIILERDVERDHDALTQLDTPSDAPATPPVEIESNLRHWQHLLNPDEVPPLLEDALVTNVAPLLATTWNQTRYYNDLMPACSGIGAAYNGHAPCGCGATAGAQLLNYYRWPFRGTGSQGYYDGSTYRTASLYTAYDWPAMLNAYVYTESYPSSNTTAIATLIRDVGYGAEMDYGCSLSASYNQSFSDAANRFFFYHQTESRSFNATAAQNEILARRPLHVSYDEGGGHILAADGVAMDGGTLYLHINYGWGGAQDGWYRPTSLYGSASLDYMTTGIEPLCMPMMTNTTATLQSKNFSVAWTFPDWHTNALDSFDLMEGVAGSAGPFVDYGNDFSNWWNEASGWRISGGQFFYCATNPHQGYIQLKEPIVPSSSSTLTYSYRRSLASVNTAYIEASSDLGKTWSVLAIYVGQVYDSSTRSGSVSLSAYNGLPTYLRVRFRHSRGVWGWYGASKETSGFYLDNVAVSSCSRLDWTPVETNLPNTTFSHSITNKRGGTFYHLAIARTTNDVEYAAPFVSQTIIDFDTFQLRAIAMTNNVMLRWNDPTLCGFDDHTVHLRSSATDYPTNLTEGTECYTGTNLVFEHTGLTPGQPYYYTAWCSDDGTNFVEP